MRILSRRSAPYVFLLPFAASFLAFTLYPLIQSLWLSLHITVGPRAKLFTGAGNYAFMLSDPEFYKALRNTAVFTLGALCIQLPIALGLALLLNHTWLKGRSAWRFAFFSPYLVGQVFTAVLFGVVFAPKYGLLNQGLAALIPGFPIDTKWLEDPARVMPALIMTALWMHAGFNMVYFLAALQSVERELYEAAAIDGANAWQRFCAVTLPGIRPVLAFVAMLTTVGSFQVYELPYNLLNNSPGPQGAGLTIVMYLYLRGFDSGDLGFAAAVGWVIAAVLLVMSMIQLRQGRERVPR